jgi:hypothetical protein
MLSRLVKNVEIAAVTAVAFMVVLSGIAVSSTASAAPGPAATPQMITYAAPYPSYSITVQDLAAGTTTNIDVGALPYYPSLSPDGETISYETYDSSDPQTPIRVYTIPSDGSALPTLLATANYRGPASWSPDGQELLYQSGTVGYKVISATTGAEISTLLYLGTGPAGFTADGQHVLLSDGGGDIWLVAIDDDSIVRLGTGLAPVESPDGSTIAYLSLPPDDSQRRLMTMSADGSNVHVVQSATPTPADAVGGYAWSGDSQTLFVETYSVVNQNAGLISRAAVDRLGTARIALPAPTSAQPSGTDHLSANVGVLPAALTPVSVVTPPTPAPVPTPPAPVPVAGARYSALTPIRVLDTRYGIGAPPSRIGAGHFVDLAIAGHYGVPANATAAVLNITGVGPTTSTWIAATPTPSTPVRPTTSTLNLTKNSTQANGVTVALSPSGSVRLFNSAGTTNLVADLMGYYSASSTSAFTPETPLRVLDTRYGTGAPLSRIGAGRYVDLAIAGHYGVPANATAVVLNITGVSPTTSTWIAATPTPSTPVRPTTSTLNLTKGSTQANGVTVALSPSGSVRLYNSGGTINLVADLLGYFSASSTSAFTPETPIRVLDTRYGTGAPPSRIAAYHYVDLVIAGHYGVPAKATAVVINVTGVSPTTSTWIAATPTPSNLNRPFKPTTSTLNLTKGSTLANSATVALSPNGSIRIYNSGGTINVVADLMGFYSR